jgi:hypothetical protein
MLENEKSRIRLMNKLATIHHPLSKNSRRAIAAMLAALVLASTACHRTTRVTTTAAGHRITAVIEGDHSIESNSGQGMIASRFGKITIERARVQIDQAPWTKISEDVPVEVRIASRRISLIAGNVTVTRAD